MQRTCYFIQGFKSIIYLHRTRFIELLISTNMLQEVDLFCIGLMSHVLLGIVLEPLLIFAPIFLEKDRLKLRLLCLSTA